MRKIVIPQLAAAAKRRPKVPAVCRTKARGLDVLNSPNLNKGTAFTLQERISLGLIGLVPPEISTLDAQARRALLRYELLPDALSRNIYLTALHDRNEVLFYRLFAEHLPDMIPIVNDHTVGMAMRHYHLESRRPRGVYLSIDQPDTIETAFMNFGAGPDQIDLIVATDAEQVLGLGDWGVGGIEVSIGKLAIYTAAGGVDPNRVIPVMLDVGTNRESLLNDPAYIGNRHARVRGPQYDEFIDAYVKVVTKLFPNALLQWEDFAPEPGRRILAKYRPDVCTFIDDMQGTGAIVLAAAVSALRICGTLPRNQRVVILGAGTAGVGVADQLRGAMVRDGLSQAEASRRFWLVDRQGLLTTEMNPPLPDFQAVYARPGSEIKSWLHDSDDMGVNLAEVVRRVKPTILISACAAPGAFTEAVIREMGASVERPIIFVLGMPANSAAATPADLLAWTDGRALIATGAAFAPVTRKGVTYVIGQTSNALIYPGLVLGKVVSGATRISDGMLSAAANAVSSLVAVRHPGASLLPHSDDLRGVSATVAVAVAEAAEAEGLARVKLDDVVQQVRDTMWEPEYRRIQAA